MFYMYLIDILFKQERVAVNKVVLLLQITSLPEMLKMLTNNFSILSEQILRYAGFPVDITDFILYDLYDLFYMNYF